MLRRHLPVLPSLWRSPAPVALSLLLRLVAPNEVQFEEERHEKKALQILCTVAIRDAKASPDSFNSCTKRFADSLKKNPEDPILISRHAEALARSEKTRDQARIALLDLEKRDLMPEAQGYAALARLLQIAGNGAEAKKAFASCKKATKHASVCSPKLKALGTYRTPRSRNRRGVVGSKS